jgi:hypothetical protein
MIVDVDEEPRGEPRWEWWRGATKMAKRKRGQAIENKQNGEMSDSAYLMISMA